MKNKTGKLICLTITLFFTSFLLTLFILPLRMDTFLHSAVICIIFFIALTPLYILIKRSHHEELEKQKQNNPYFAILEKIPEIVVIHQNGMILYINQTGAKTLGANTPEELLGKSVYHFLHPANREQAKEGVKLLEEKSTLDLVEQRATSLDGQEIHLETITFSIDYNGQKAILSISRNISLKKKAREEQIQNEVKYRTIFEYANDAIYLFGLDNDGMPLNFIDINQIGCERFGYTKEELLAMTPLDITSNDRLDKIQETQQKLLEKGYTTFEGEYISKSGEKIPSEISVRILRLGDANYALAISRDISERKKAQEKIKQLAYTDSLTNLYNRKYFKKYLDKAIGNPIFEQEQLAVLFIDINRFKIINKTLGPHIGDLLLIEVAKRLKLLVSEKSLLARQSDDEFSIVIRHANQEIATELSEQIIYVFQHPFIIEGHKIFTTPSIGISLYPINGKDADTLIKNADTAMFVAKTKGANVVEYYSDEMIKKNKRKMLLESALRNALHNNELHLHYQPKVNLQTRKLVGVEALLRWNSNKYGMISPGEFIPIAEETGLIIPIGEWVLKTACTQNKQWQDEGYEPITMCINLSARQFQQYNILDKIANILQETNLEPKYLNIEVTETMAMIDLEQSIEKLNALKRLGVSISLDDFGTGYSSLNYLHKFPLDVLKIDQSFIRNINSDKQSAAIVKAIISVSKSLDLTVIAEGVEIIDQIDFLLSEQCDEVQGYYFSPPVPSKKLEEMLTPA
ncbi:EAL domain-containing protein [Metabacillus niabensis]|uniref:Diguanylate cyclase (GGDEF)-like protein/PAS domain S-box-containing protein n=4 Tax=Metabacillus niabensis TaxID=324854 RepID=A0ABT9Z2X2_9BACI|nr:EAL domain-containing protein [Metabacillus niabensis]MDQ0226604.1 diguanylate cyclase (GGDEF)-like protein/PAS domain S-box-containing protein [Metabacillus niabensis]